MTIGPHPRGPAERLRRQRAVEARSRAKRREKHAVYMHLYRAAHPGLSTKYVRVHRAAQLEKRVAALEEKADL